MSQVKWYTQQNDGVRGERIVVEARRIKSPQAISGATGRHGAMQTVAKQNAKAWIELPYAPDHKFHFE